MSTQQLGTELATISTQVQLINMEDKLTLKVLAEKINELVNKMNSLESAPVGTAARDRGPKSQHEMTEDDARRIMLGDLKDKSHKECCEALGLSYGQVYSARKGFTFKPVYQEMIKAPKAAESAAAESAAAE